MHIGFKNGTCFFRSGKILRGTWKNGKFTG